MLLAFRPSKPTHSRGLSLKRKPSLATKRDLDVALTCEIDPLKADLLLLKCLSGLILVGILVLGVLLWS